MGILQIIIITSISFLLYLGNGTVVKTEPLTPNSKMTGSGLKDEVLQYYSRAGLEPVAQQVRLDQF